MNMDELCEYGIDWKTGVSRFMGSEKLYRKLLAMFPADTTFPRMKSSWEARNYDELFQGAHEMKGVSGNVALTRLYDADSLLLEYLRAGGRDEDNILALFAAVEAEYEKTVLGISLLQM